MTGMMTRVNISWNDVLALDHFTFNNICKVIIDLNKPADIPN